MKTGIYLRVSTEDQAVNGYGLEVQRERCTAQAVAKGWEVVQEYTDEGISGAKDASERPGLAAMMQDVCNGEIEAVITLALDRLGRKAKILLDVYDALDECGAVVVLCKESIDTSTPAGKMMRTIFAAFAEFERDNIIERMTDGRNARGKVDGDKGGRVPMGYQRTDEGVQVVQDEAETVKVIFAMREAGSTLSAIAESLNSQGIMTSRGGAKWYPSSVREVLLNEDKYRGGYRGESQERWPAILESHDR